MPSLTKLALRTLIGSVVISAALGIIAILSGDGGWHQARILLTTATISGTSIGTLACAALLERRRNMLMPLTGIVLTLSGGVLTVAGIWAEISAGWYWKTTIAVIVFAIATAHWCLLSLARLAPRFRWASLAAGVAMYGLAATITSMVVAEEAGLGWFQLVGVTAIGVASLSILIPIFHRLSASPEAAVPGHSGAVTCPWCGTRQAQPLGEITCATCRCVFVIRILQPGRTVSP